MLSRPKSNDCKSFNFVSVCAIYSAVELDKGLFPIANVTKNIGENTYIPLDYDEYLIQ